MLPDSYINDIVFVPRTYVDVLTAGTLASATHLDLNRCGASRRNILPGVVLVNWADCILHAFDDTGDSDVLTSAGTMY
jgi:hypothetical protein